MGALLVALICGFGRDRTLGKIPTLRHSPELDLAPVLDDFINRLRVKDNARTLGGRYGFANRPLAGGQR
jgi:hypothetical protein